MSSPQVHLGSFASTQTGPPHVPSASGTLLPQLSPALSLSCPSSRTWLQVAFSEIPSWTCPCPSPTAPSFMAERDKISGGKATQCLMSVGKVNAIIQLDPMYFLWRTNQFVFRYIFMYMYKHPEGSWWLSGKESACSAGDVGSLPPSGRSPGERNVNPLQDSCSQNPTDRRAWRAAVHGVSKELDTTEQLNNVFFFFFQGVKAFITW